MSEFATQAEADAAFKAASEVSPDYHIERIKRSRFKTDTELSEHLRPIDPATITDAPKLTRSQEALVNEVMGIAFARA